MKLTQVEYPEKNVRAFVALGYLPNARVPLSGTGSTIVTAVQALRSEVDDIPRGIVEETIRVFEINKED